MADFAYKTTAHNKADEDPYDGHEYGIELSEVPRSRAPSYVSRDSLWTGTEFEHDEDKLINQGRLSTYSRRSKIDEGSIHAISHTTTTQSNRERRKKYKGWHFGVLVSAWTAFAVLFLNLILTIWAVASFSLEGGVGTAYTGSCETTNTWATGLHIVINALSSILLSASNYTMQCLCSPTRAELDEAHARGDWMDVGVPSVRNIFKIGWRRSLIWWLLALSSIPIHLLYNSAIFKTLDANDYIMGVVNTDFLLNQPFAAYTFINGQPDTIATNWTQSVCMESSMGISDCTDYGLLQNLQAGFANDDAYLNPNLTANLSNSDCIAAYGSSFVTGYTNLLAVTSAKGNQTNETLFWYNFASYSSLAGGGNLSPINNWICTNASTSPGYATNDCNVAQQRQNANTWKLAGYDIDYCLAEITIPRCKLQFSLQILITVILMNAMKSACMFLTLYRQRETTLVTIGDALASYLDQPDELTKGRCLMAKVDVGKGPMRWKLQKSHHVPNTKPPAVTYFAPLRRRWFAAVSITRWGITMGLCGAAIVTGSILLAVGASQIGTYLSKGQSVFGLGFGAVDSRSTLSAGLPQGGAGGLVAAVLLANLPQAVVSFLYLTYNGLLTCMLLCDEYSKYAMDSRKKSLRVTTPHGQQRSTYYLHLPYTYSIPLVIASGTLHWLISQSIFLARISIYTAATGGRTTTTGGSGDNDPEQDVSAVGYSCLPILLVILLGTCMLLVAVGFGFRKFKSHIPVAGSCSVALAAAAHPPKNDVDAAYLPVRWGEVNKEGDEQVGHCCFTSEDVHDLIPGRMYAGAAESFATGTTPDAQAHQRHPGSLSRLGQ